MIKKLKNKYDFKLRLATKDEIGALVEFLAKKNWEDKGKELVKYKNGIRVF